MVLLEISPSSQENTCARVSLKKRLWHRCFPVNFAKFLKTPFSQNTSGRLLLKFNSFTLQPVFERVVLLTANLWLSVLDFI